jgi:hypothetical protein
MQIYATETPKKIKTMKQKYPEPDPPIPGSKMNCYCVISALQKYGPFFS